MGMSASGPMGMSLSGANGLSSAGSSVSGITAQPSQPYLLLSSPSRNNTFAAPVPSPALISIFSSSTPSVQGYTSKPLTSAAPDVIDLKKSSEIDRSRERDRERDIPNTGDPTIQSNESSCTTRDTDNNTTIDNKIDNKVNNSNSNHSSISTNGGDGSQNIDDKDGLLALEGLLSLSKY